MAPHVLGDGPRRVDALPADLVPASTAKVLRWAQDHPDCGVLYVIVESWGLARSTAVRRWLREQLLPAGLEQDYDVRERAITFKGFKGSTTDGELRSLCGLRGSYELCSPVADAG